MLVANPDYASLLAQIAAETDPVIKQQLIEQCYVFETEPTLEEKELFEYCAFDYIQDNPGYVDGASQVPVDTGLFVAAGYVADGYINTLNANTDTITGLYMDAGYVANGYIIDITSEYGTGWSAYTGVYYNNNGETT